MSPSPLTQQQSAPQRVPATVQAPRAGRAAQASAAGGGSAPLTALATVRAAGAGPAAQASAAAAGQAAGAAPATAAAAGRAGGAAPPAAAQSQAPPAARSARPQRLRSQPGWPQSAWLPRPAAAGTGGRWRCGPAHAPGCRSHKSSLRPTGCCTASCTTAELGWGGSVSQGSASREAVSRRCSGGCMGGQQRATSCTKRLRPWQPHPACAIRGITVHAALLQGRETLHGSTQCLLTCPCASAP